MASEKSPPFGSENRVVPGGTSTSSLAESMGASLTYVDIGAGTPEQQAWIASYKSLLQSQGRKSLVTLGFYKGLTAWDIRAVFLEPEANNRLLLMRISDPHTSLPDDIKILWPQLGKVLAGAYIASGIDTISLGESARQVSWSLRYFCNATLAEDLTSTNRENLKRSATSNCLTLISQLSELETSLAPHGHLVRSNLGILEEKIVLLDPWYHQLSPSTSKLSQDELSVRSFASLFLNLFVANLDEHLVVALQQAVATQETPGIRVEGANNKGHLPFSQLRRSIDRIDPKNLEAEQSMLSSSIAAPTGKIIVPRERKKSSEPKVAVSELATKQTVASPDKTASNLAEIYHSIRSSPSLSRPILFFSVALLTALLVLITFKALNISSLFGNLEEYQADWLSGDSERQKIVAEAALETGDIDAQSIIEQDLLAGNERNGVNAKLLRIALNKSWREKLSSKDIHFALSLALAGLYRVPSDTLPSLSELHPGIILALVGDLSLSRGEGKFDSIEIAKLASLPAPYGSVFTAFQNFGAQNLGDGSVRAAARIITGSNDPETLAQFMDSSTEITELKLTSIVPFAEMYPELADSMLSFLSERGDALGQRVTWFVSEPSAEWSKVSSKNLLYIVVGLIPESVNEFEKTTDLLQYPIPGIRDQARKKLLSIFADNSFEGLLNLLSSPPFPLSRTQSLGLLSTTRVTPDRAAPFIDSWLSTNPNSQVVLQFLLACRDRKSYDSVFVQLANYLAKNDFETSTRELGQLITHPEALARALAFPRLDASLAADRKTLEAWLARENSARLKEQIQTKLNAGLSQD